MAEFCRRQPSAGGIFPMLQGRQTSIDTFAESNCRDIETCILDELGINLGETVATIGMFRGLKNYTAEIQQHGVRADQVWKRARSRKYRFVRGGGVLGSDQ